MTIKLEVPITKTTYVTHVGGSYLILLHKPIKEHMSININVLVIVIFDGKSIVPLLLREFVKICEMGTV